MYGCDFPDERREHLSRISVQIVNTVVYHDVVVSCIHRFHFKLLEQLTFTVFYILCFSKLSIERNVYVNFGTDDVNAFLIYFKL